MTWPSNFTPSLLEAGAETSGLAEFVQKAAGLKGWLDVNGLTGGGLSLALARAARESGRSLLVVTPSIPQADSLIADLEFFLPDREVHLFPAYGHLPFSRLSAHPWTVARRIRCLWRMISADKPLVVVAPAAALLGRLTPQAVLNDFAELILEGEEIDREALLAKLVQGGYTPTALVEEPGDLAVRGGIVDIFGALDDDPLRLEFFGDFVDSLRLFRPSDQRSTKIIQESIILPMSEVVLSPEALNRGRQGLARLDCDPAKILELREPLTNGLPFEGAESFLPLFYEKTESLLDYAAGNSLVCLVDPAAIEQQAAGFLDGLADRVERLKEIDSPHLAPERACHTWDEINDRLESMDGLAVRPLRMIGTRPKIDLDCRSSIDLPPAKNESGASILSPLLTTVRWLNDNSISPWLVCRTSGQLTRLTGLLEEYGLTAVNQPAPPGRPPAQAADLHLIQGGLSSGFIMPAERLVVLTEEEALGQTRVKRTGSTPKPQLPTAQIASHLELTENDLVVHQDHGIGRFTGLVNMEVNGVMGDYLLLEYKDGDKLYLPADRLNLAAKYIGPEGKNPPLDRLGGVTWKKTTGKVKKKLLEIAQDLVDLYAARQVRHGFAFSSRDKILREFETTFEYEETPDQARAIDDVIADMARERPMDRLICGDVGYGKTEVALRAAFRAAMDGKQVAILAPTTVLVEQHQESFSARLEPFPIRVESLSRFKTAAEQKKVLLDLEKGLVDIVIGTHRLLSKDVIFPNLGLVIIDEEHRFGVKHKERLKHYRQTVDVLAMTATPIPRTLQMSLLDIRDLSVIDSPPQSRQAVSTYLSHFDPAVIQEAIGREMDRGGQVFFVHNRVKDIVTIANFIKKLMPTARIEVAHGQMSERVLEKVMFKFIRGEVDVLVSTTIIESGLDIPSANTIIINQADRLGLAQIYQLRGRVGRSAQKAYAYLLIPEEAAITHDALKRLKVMMDLTHLGAGFKIAMHDLKIRGGGNLLGQAQAGHIGQVGYEMYLTLMEQAIAELKGVEAVKEVDPELNLPFSAFLPESYIAEPNQRLALYRRLAMLKKEQDLTDLIEEINDRFGRPPAEVENLIKSVRLRLTLRRLGVSRLDVNQGVASAAFVDNPPVNLAKLIDLARSRPRAIRLTPDSKLIVHNRNPLGELEKIFGMLAADL